MKSWLSSVLNKVAQWLNEGDGRTEKEFPSFINKSRFLYGGRG